MGTNRRRGLPAEQQKAREALRQKESDPSKEENLEQILNKTQQDYSLVKQGWWDIFLNVDYTYFGDARSQDALILEQTRSGRNQPLPCKSLISALSTWFRTRNTP